MSEKKVIPEDFVNLIKRFRSEDYIQATADFCKKVGISKDTTCAQMECLLIYSTEECYAPKTIERDIMLMAFGLLKEFGHIKNSGKDGMSLKDRKKLFAKRSNFISKYYKNSYTSYEEVERMGKIKQVTDALDGRIKTYTDAVTARLYHIYMYKNIEEYMKNAIKQYSTSNKDYLPNAALPDLINIMEKNLQPQNFSGANGETKNNGDIDELDIGKSDLPSNDTKLQALDDLGDGNTELKQRKKINIEVSEVGNIIDVGMTDSLFANLAGNADIKNISPSTKTIKDDLDDNDVTLLPSDLGEKTSGGTVSAIINEGGQLPSNAGPSKQDASEEDTEDPFVPSEHSKKKLPKWIKIVARCICTIIMIIAIIVTAKDFIGHIDEGVKLLIFIFLLISLLAVVYICGKIYQEIIHIITKKRGTNTWRYRSYTTRQIQEGKLGNRIILNSVSDGKDDGGYNGNEKKFMLAKEVNEAMDNVWQSGTIEVEDQKEYLLRIYVCNDNPGGRDAIAEEVRVDFFIPEKSSKEIQVWGMIFAKNTRPKKYTDSILFTNNWFPFHLEYDYEPIKLYNSGIGKDDGYSLGHEDLFTQMYIGYDSLDGSLPGGDEFSTNIILKAKVVFDNSFIINYQVTHFSDSKKWKDETVAKVDDRLACRIRFKNISNETQHNVLVTVIFPQNLHYISSFDSKLDDMYRLLILDSSLAIGAPVNIGDYAPGAVATICFDMEIVDNDLALGNNELISYLQVEIDDLIAEDYIKILVNKE